MAFSELYGLDGPIAVLRKALASDRLAGSYLFVGPPSVGKTALALEFAKAAACLEPKRDPFEACGGCASCKLAEVGRHPEIVLISPAGDQTQIWQFWDRDGKPAGALSRTMSYGPTVGRRRVYIVERAETLNEAAANSLLKALEEPPPYALFVLASPHLSRILPTVISRCQLVRVPATPVAPLAKFVAEETGVPSERAAVCAAYSEGRTGIALRLAREVEAGDEIGRAVDLAIELANAEPLAALRLGEAIRKLSASMKAVTQDEMVQGGAGDSGDDAGPATKERAGRKQVGAVLELLTAAYRDLVSLSMGGNGSQITHAERLAELSLAATGSSPDRWMRGLDTLLKARRRLDQNTSIPMLTDWVAMRLVMG